MMAKILKVKSQNSLKAAVDRGIAMQLTNIARDVVEDSKRNRNYINPDFETIKKTLELADLPAPDIPTNNKTSGLFVAIFVTLP